MESLLNAVYYRNLCPSSTQLLDYHLGLLANQAERDLRLHVEMCPHCAEDVRHLFELGLQEQPTMGMVSQRQSLLDRLRQLVSNQPLLPAFAQAAIATPALRSGGEDDIRIFLSGDLRLTVALNRTTQGATLECSVLDQADPDNTPTGTATLLDESSDVASAQSLDEYGLFTFTPVSTGPYTLVVQLPTHSIYVHKLTV